MLKPQQNKKLPQNSPNQASKLDSNLSKKRDRRGYSKQRYQAKKQEYHEWYLKRKTQREQQQNEQQSKYYGAEAIKVLISLKEYTELNSQKHKLWLDFNWTLKDCQEAFKKGFGNVVAVMKLEQVAHELINDYRTTAKNEIKKGQSWNSLDQDQKDRLIRYWGYEKSRIENGYLEEEERLQKQSQVYLKEIDLAKFHEERGKVKCPCYGCQNKREIQKEIKVKMDKELREVDNDKEQCPECGKWVKELDEENDICKRCMSEYE